MMKSKGLLTLTLTLILISLITLLHIKATFELSKVKEPSADGLQEAKTEKRAEIIWEKENPKNLK